MQRLSEVAREAAARIRQKWCADGCSAEAFTAAAVQELNRVDFVRLANSGAFAEEISGLGSGGNVAFGQPTHTAYWDTDFRIDFMLWSADTTGIHQHAFAGAFAVLSGRSVEFSYSFDSLVDVDDGLSVGNLEMITANILDCGAVRPIPAGSDLIHAVAHLGQPSISIVIRTYDILDFQPETSYHPPFIAMKARPPGGDVVESFRSAISLLDASPDAAKGKLLDLASRADNYTIYQILLSAIARCSLEAYQQLWAIFETRFPTMARGKIKASLDEHKRRELLVDCRAALIKPEHELLAALLLSCPDFKSIQGVLSQQYPETDSIEVIEREIIELSDMKGIDLSTDAEILSILSCCVRRMSDQKMIEYLSQLYTVDAVLQAEAEIRGIAAQIRSRPLLLPLFV